MVHEYAMHVHTMPCILRHAPVTVHESIVDLAEFLYTALLYQAMINRNINAATLLEQYSVLVEKEQWGNFFTQPAGYCERVIRFNPRLIISND